MVGRKTALKLVWPALIGLGLLIILAFDQGNGLSSPAFWLIPIGVVGGLASIFRHEGSKPSAETKAIIAVWSLAFLLIGGLTFGWLTEGFGRFIWIFPSAIFTIIGCVMLAFQLFRSARN